jgi:Na+/H+-dicarboxylate symporter
MTLSIRILIGLAVGIAFGLFVGEYADNLSWIGEVFIGLVQMTVLAYIVVSLVANIGHLSTEQARRVLRIGGALLAIFLAIGTIALGIIPLSFPKLGTAAFFSRSLIEPRKSIDVLDLYVPDQPLQLPVNGNRACEFQSSPAL